MQAARGTPVGDGPDGADGPGPTDEAVVPSSQRPSSQRPSSQRPSSQRPSSQRPASRRLLLLFAAVALALYAVDQVSKILAVAELDGRREDVQVVGTLLQLHLTRNPGAAFSTGTGFTPVLSVIALVAALAVLWFARRLGSTGWAVAFGFLLAGITGNLTDRLLREPGPFHGHVIDFLRLPNWPIFNVAAALIVIQTFRGIRLDGTRDADDETETGSESGETVTDVDGDETADAGDSRRGERS